MPVEAHQHARLSQVHALKIQKPYSYTHDFIMIIQNTLKTV